jgi:hypothetical protein
MGIMKRLHADLHLGRPADETGPDRIGKLTWWIRYSCERERARIAADLTRAEMRPIGLKPGEAMVLPTWIRGHA